MSRKTQTFQAREERKCRSKNKYSSEAEVNAIATKDHSNTLRGYQCDICKNWHLTSKLKGKRAKGK